MKRKKKAPVYSAHEDLILTIPFGFVMHYEGVSGFTREGIARNVASCLSKLPEDTNVPWWRVVGKQGEYGILRTSGDRARKQRELLEGEGVVFDRQGRFVFNNYRYRPPTRERLAA